MRQLILVGIGGAGMNMLAGASKGMPVPTLAVSREAASLAKTYADFKVMLNTRKYGMRAMCAAVHAVRHEILAAVRDAPVAVLLLGLGGYTGSWAGPEVARVIRESGRRVLAFAVMPFAFEGPDRRERAERALDVLEAVVDQVRCIENQRLIEKFARGTSMQDAFGMVDDAIGKWLANLGAQNQF